MVAQEGRTPFQVTGRVIAEDEEVPRLRSLADRPHGGHDLSVGHAEVPISELDGHLVPIGLSDEELVVDRCLTGNPDRCDVATTAIPIDHRCDVATTAPAEHTRCPHLRGALDRSRLVIELVGATTEL